MAQSSIYTPIRSKDFLVQDQYFRAVDSLWIPYVNSTVPTLNGTPDSTGNGLQLLNNGTLAISKGSAAGYWNYLPSTVLATTYQPLITAGTTLQYYRGDKTFQTLNTTAVVEGTNLYATNARSLNYVLTGYTIGANTALAATDTYLGAFQKIQGQISANVTSIGLKQNLVTLTTTGSGGATFNQSTGALNIPTPTAPIAETLQTVTSRGNTTTMGLVIGGGVSVAGQLTAAVAPINSTDVVRKTELDLKQDKLSGTGFVKVSGTTISYDNSTYLTSADISGKANLSGGNTFSGNQILNNSLTVGTTITADDLITSKVGFRYGLLSSNWVELTSSISGSDRLGQLKLTKALSSGASGSPITATLTIPNTISANRIQTLQDADGIIALTTDIPTFSNGLTNSSGAVKLGGLITQDTILTTNNNYNFIIYNSATLVSSNIGGDLRVYANSSTGVPGLQLGAKGAINSSYIRVFNTGFEIEDSIANKGMYYLADYSANFTARSLVDKAYVDARVAQTIPVVGTTQALLGGNTYILHNTSLTTVTLPTTNPVEGTLITLIGDGVGGFRVSQNASQFIVSGNATTTVGTGGYIQTTANNSFISLRYVNTNKWMVSSSNSAITIV